MPFLHLVGVPQANHRTPYGKAWYINPELWGLGSSPQEDSEVLDQESDKADGGFLDHVHKQHSR